MKILTDDIAAKFIQYYWRQAVPYAGADAGRILLQNTGRQAAIINLVSAARATQGDSLANFMNKSPTWRQLVRSVADVVRVMPLWKLQTVGPERLEFLYDNAGDGHTVELRPGVAYCLRKFHPLISDLIRGAWVRYVRRQNLQVLGETADLNEFLFGSERNGLALVRPVLLDIQHGRCFYCNGQINDATAHVDHFIAWYAIQRTSLIISFWPIAVATTGR